MSTEGKQKGRLKSPPGSMKQGNEAFVEKGEMTYVDA